jgi:hypothetical protein
MDLRTNATEPLGPLLFLTYINDMPEMVKSSETKLFADDSLLFHTINNQAEFEGPFVLMSATNTFELCYFWFE